MQGLLVVGRCPVGLVADRQQAIHLVEQLEQLGKGLVGRRQLVVVVSQCLVRLVVE